MRFARLSPSLRPTILAGVVLFVTSAAFSEGAEVKELAVKRQEVFEFVSKPVLERSGDHVDIRFEVKAACDATVAIENAEGRIVRHLASGVLGPHAPEPFQKDSLKQNLRWDGKDDGGQYVDRKSQCKVRVSLGLKASLDRVMLWDAKRRYGRQAPILKAVPEGMLVYDGGNSVDFVKLYDRSGAYVRTVYPIPASKIGKVEGLPSHDPLNEGRMLPRKPTFLQNTFLTSGNAFGYERPEKFRFEASPVNGEAHYGMFGNAASFMAVGAGRVVLGDQYINRMAVDGTSAGLPFEGPRCALLTPGQAHDTRGRPVGVPPRSGALSPDGKTLYLTGYNFCHYGKAANDIVTSGAWDAFHCVMKLDLSSDKPPELFAGKPDIGAQGADDASFRIPIAVAVDAQGRVYVADYMNDRVQVFDAAGKLLRKIPAKRPASLCIAAKSQNLYVFSWLIHNKFVAEKGEEVPPKLTRYTGLDQPKRDGEWNLPGEYKAGKSTYLYSGTGIPFEGAVDEGAQPPMVWLAREWQRENVLTKGKIAYHGIELYEITDKGLEKKHAFSEEIRKTLPHATATRYGRMRLYANEKSGLLYLGEGETANEKAFKELTELDPATGSFRVVPLPFDAEDMCFDRNGYAYLRSMAIVGRFDSTTWKEVPWDYGDEMKGVCTSSSSDRKTCDLASGLILPCNGDWHHGGMYVSPQGNLVAVCGYHFNPELRTDEKKTAAARSVTYKPKMFPGRSMASRAGGTLINVYSLKGKLIGEDIVPGLPDLYGVGLDHAGKLYVLSSSTRVWDGKRYPNAWSGTIVKVDPGLGRVLTTGEKDMDLPLPEGDVPKRDPELQRGGNRQWVEGAEWFYGGVGFCGKNSGRGCACHNTRFALDYFARSFAPEVDRFSVGVVDASGNLILRIGRYGNADSAGAKSLEALGSDEVGLMHGAYVATLTDRKLFVADPSNDRILSVNLLYHVDERVGIPDDPAEAGR